VRYRLRLAVAAARQADTEQTAALVREAERGGLSSNELLAVASGTGPNPGCIPVPGGPGNAGSAAAR
jgi:hypothetical protein